MRRTVWLLLPTVLAIASPARPEPEDPSSRGLAEPSDAPIDAKRVVVTEGDAKTTRLVNELEQELRASSYVIVRVPKVALEPEAMLRTLRDARAARGILLSNDGKSVIVLAASRGGTALRVYGEYSLDRDNRLARRRQWISLVERLRVPTDDEEEGPPEVPWNEPTDASSGQPAHAASELTKRAPSDAEEPIDRRTSRLGVTVALGYITGRTGLVSHLLLVGQHRLSPRICLIAHGLWPMVPGERATADRVRSRVWTFGGNLGLSADLGRPSWRVNPYLGMTTGLQFLLAYVDRSDDAITDVYRVASMTLDLYAGVRLEIRRGTWLMLQVSGGRLTSLATRPGEMTDSLSDAWALHSAIGLMMAL
jgi:hypothetical protein